MWGWGMAGQHRLVGTPLDVPLALGPSAAFGDPYGTGRSAWIPISGRQQIAAVASP